MIASIYARKSTEQTVADEAKSITRQIEHARDYARRKGWTVADEYTFVDDGISGAEFSRRPGFLRLMNALKPRPAFQVLVMSEESRLGREAIETAYALKQLVTAGVRVFFYLEDRERTLGSPTDKIMLSLTTFADELSVRRHDSGPSTRCSGRRGPATSPAAGCSATTTSTSSVRTARAHMSSGASKKRKLRSFVASSSCVRMGAG
jgi:hypothetical protein